MEGRIFRELKIGETLAIAGVELIVEAVSRGGVTVSVAKMLSPSFTRHKVSRRTTLTCARPLNRVEG